LRSLAQNADNRIKADHDDQSPYQKPAPHTPNFRLLSITAERERGRGSARLTRRATHCDTPPQYVGTVRAGQWKTKIIALSERAIAVLKECELLGGFHAFRYYPHMQILTHADQGADDVCVVRIGSDATHKRPINLQGVDRKASEMA
jgi:hypothetical protein